MKIPKAKLAAVSSRLMDDFAETHTKLAAQGIKRWPIHYRQGKRPGVVLMWQAETTEDRYRALSGQVGGKVKVGAWSHAYAQNVGKSNAKTAEEQAEFIVQAKSEKLLKSGGYFLSIADIGKMQFTFPMLAHKYVKGETKLTFPLLFQAKLNGFRCVIKHDGMWTRTGERINSCPHIFASVEWVFQKLGKTLILDGELYNHDLYENLEEFGTLVRKQKPTDDHLERTAELVQFHIYDAYHLGGEAERQDVRLKRLPTIVANSRGAVAAVPTAVVTSEAQLEQLYRKALEDHYEGGMLRWPAAPYSHDRSAFLLKYKPRDSAEFKILRIEDGNGKRKGRAARVWCVTDKGVEFKANVKWSDAKKEEIYRDRDKYVGKQATVSFAYITVYGKPFHAYVEALWLKPKI